MSITWIIIIAIYLIISIYLGSKNTGDNIIDRIPISPKGDDERVTVLSFLKRIPMLVLLLCMLVFFLPAGIVEIFRIAKENRHKREIKKEARAKEERRKERRKLDHLLFGDIHGAGTLVCLDCGHQEDIVKFLHGFGEEHYSETGHQCQECGNLVAVVKDKNREPNYICACGGILRRDKLLFCSQCRSFRQKYDWKMIS